MQDLDINFIKYKLQQKALQMSNNITNASNISVLSKLRQYHERVAKKVQSDPYDVKLGKEVTRYKTITAGEQNRMINNNQYEHYEEVTGYLQKFTALEKLIADQTANKISSADYANKARQLFLSQDQNYNATSLPPRISNSSTPNQQLNFYQSGQGRSISPQKQALDQFFDSKYKQNQPKNFDSLLTNPNISPRNFKKKKDLNQQQLRKLQQQNRNLKNQLQSGRIPPQQHKKLEDTYSNQKQRIQLLQSQNRELSQTNYILRSQKSNSVVTQSNYDDDYLYSPYTFTTRRNNIHEINMRNLSDNGNIQQADFSQHELKPVRTHKVIHKKVGYQYQTYTEQDYNNDRGNTNFSIFDMNRSTYSENGDFSNLRHGIESEKTMVRNKNAFFRPKGLLIRNEDIEIGVKRSDPDASNMVRVILYFHNKNQQYKPIQTNYEYEQDYYEVTVVERVRQIQSFRQARQVVEVKLRGDKKDFNSVIYVQVTVGRDVYKLLLPAAFMLIKKMQGSYSRNGSDEVSQSIQPNRSFRNLSDATKVIDNLTISGNDQAYFYVQSVKGNGPVKLSWKSQKNKLKVTANKKWLTFFTFLMTD